MPPKAPKAAAVYSTAFAPRRMSKSSTLACPNTWFFSSGSFSTPATMPASGVPKIAAKLAAIVTSATDAKRKPAFLIWSRIQQQPEVMSPVRPASKPMEPPNTKGNRNETTGLTTPFVLYEPVSLNSPITSSSERTLSCDHHVHSPMRIPPSVHTARGNHHRPSAPPTVFHKSCVSHVDRFITRNTAKPMTNPMTSANSTKSKRAETTRPPPPGLCITSPK